MYNYEPISQDSNLSKQAKLEILRELNAVFPCQLFGHKLN